MKTILGVELGSTRIKAVAIDERFTTVSSGDYMWKSDRVNGVWTYDLNEVWTGLRSAVSGIENLEDVEGIGLSAMMHGYLAFDSDWNLLTPFRTWQNTITGPAAAELTALFGFNIPQRWSVAHLYQAMLNGEEHLSRLAHITTLAGYVHHAVTGVNAVGVGEAAGMFPIDSESCDYDEGMLAKFDALCAKKGYAFRLRELLPEVLVAGENAGTLTENGALLLDPTGHLRAGIALCPPEGDAGTGMTATNSVAVRTGNVSAGTSVFAMVVLERPLAALHTEIDMVTTPTGKPVAMVHCNNCTNEINAWAGMLRGFLEALGQTPDMNAVYTAMFTAARAGAPDAGGIVAFNNLAGEPVTDLSEGRPLLARAPEAELSFANVMRAQLYAAVATLKLGMDILAQENVVIDRLLGHGGYFKTPEVGQRIMAAAMGVPVSVMENAGEGGPWGMALLCAYLLQKADGQTLEDFLASRVFAGQAVHTVQPELEEQAGFARFLASYKNALRTERSAIETIK